MGMVDGFERYCELSARDEALCELQPPQNGYAPVVFLFNESLLHHPPRGAAVCLLQGGVAIYAHTFYRHAPVFSLIAQKKCPVGELTVFSQGMPQALFRNGADERMLVLNENFSECSILGGEKILLLSGKNELCALDTNGEFFRGKIIDYAFDEENGTLHARAPLGDFCGRTARCAWMYDRTSQRAVLKSCEVDEGVLPPPRFILCVLLQNLLLGIDVENLLSPELYAAQKELKGYFGRYVKVVTSPQYPFGAGMVCPKDKDLYELKYFSAEVEAGKIVNVKRMY